jgi:glycosyltransferase involved in cell wall biosynthesis
MARRVRTLFVVPSAEEPPTGGNLYNEGLLRALAAQGEHFARSSLAQLDAAGGEFDEVWLDSLYLSHGAALRARFLCARRFALLLHALPSSLARAEGREHAPWQRLEAEALSAFDVALATSETSAELLASAAPTLPCWVIPPAIQPAQDASRWAYGTVRAVIVANLTPNKGLLPFLRALAQRARADDDFALSCLGRTDVDPVYAQACTRRLREHPLLAARVELAGVQSPAQVSQALSRAELLISASRFESFGMAIADARASGCVVLAHAGGHVARLVDAQAGGAVCVDDDALADAFLACVRDRVQLAARLEQAAQHRLAARDYAQVARAFLSHARVADAGAPRNAQ